MGHLASSLGLDRVPAPAQLGSSLDPLSTAPGWPVSLVTNGLSTGWTLPQAGVSLSLAPTVSALKPADYKHCGFRLPRGAPCPTQHICWRLGLRVQPEANYCGPRQEKRSLCETQTDRKAVVSPGSRDPASQEGGWVGRERLGFWEHRPETNFMGKTFRRQDDSRACCS